MWQGVIKCLLYDKTITISDEFQVSIFSIFPTNYPDLPPDAEIQVKLEISNYHCNLLPTKSCPIFMIFETALEFTNSINMQMYDKIQDGGCTILKMDKVL